MLVTVGTPVALAVVIVAAAGVALRRLLGGGS
jgi:hypothetical protein